MVLNQSDDVKNALVDNLNELMNQGKGYLSSVRKSPYRPTCQNLGIGAQKKLISIGALLRDINELSEKTGSRRKSPPV